MLTFAGRAANKTACASLCKHCVNTSLSCANTCCVNTPNQCANTYLNPLFGVPTLAPSPWRGSRGRQPPGCSLIVTTKCRFSLVGFCFASFLILIGFVVVVMFCCFVLLCCFVSGPVRIPRSYDCNRFDNEPPKVRTALAPPHHLERAPEPVEAARTARMLAAAFYEKSRRWIRQLILGSQVSKPSASDLRWVLTPGIPRVPRRPSFEDCGQVHID